MKRSYIQPQTKVEQAQCEMLLAASQLDANIKNKSINLKDDEYNGVFAVKEYNFGDDFDN
jgi:hypothetical protein